MHLTAHINQREFLFLRKYSCETRLAWNIFRFLLWVGFNFTLKFRNPHCIPALLMFACTILLLRGAADSEWLLGKAQILSASMTKGESTNLSTIQNPERFGVKRQNGLSEILMNCSILGNANATFVFKLKEVMFVLLDKYTVFVKCDLSLHH